MFLDEPIATLGQGLGPEVTGIWDKEDSISSVWPDTSCLFRQKSFQEPNSTIIRVFVEWTMSSATALDKTQECIVQMSHSCSVI